MYVSRMEKLIQAYSIWDQRSDTSEQTVIDGNRVGLWAKSVDKFLFQKNSS